MGSIHLGIVGVIAAATSASAAPAFPNLGKIVAVKDVTASSTYADKNNAYAAWRTLAYETRGGDLSGPEIVWSAWCEGKPDEGIGEMVTVTLAEPTQIDSVAVAAGVWRNAGLYAGNNQITALEVIADGKSQTIKPTKRDDWAVAKIGAKVTTIAFKVAAVKKGKMNDSCISGIQLRRGGDTIAPLIGVDAKAAAALSGAIKDINAALEKPDKAGLEPHLAFPFAARDADGFFNGPSGKPVTSTSFAALQAACKKYAAAPEDADYTDPKGCPLAVDVREDDDRHPRVKTTAPGTVNVTFPSGREIQVVWKLVWKNRWRLSSIDYE